MKAGHEGASSGAGGTAGPCPRIWLPALLLAGLALALPPAAAVAQTASSGEHPEEASDHESSRPSVAAVPLAAPIRLDGRLTEAAWRTAPTATGFIQSEPEEGQPATQRTEVRFLFDDGNLYVGARMHDDEGSAGVRSRLVRRDGDPESDYLELVFDTFHDHLGRTRFRVNPVGVRGDAQGLGGGFADPSWDPVWETATAVDSAGWTAELRIPLSQLEFPEESLQTWGLQIVRYVQRLNERSHWAFVPLEEQGGPARYGHLRGLELSGAGGNLEVVPYVVARSSHVAPSDPSDPLADPDRADLRLGADVHYELSSRLSLDATFNPDFGQVEVDPAVVNLSAFETFFPEKRPFFVEGAGLFDFGGFRCFFCSNVSSLGLFFSRRIGRRPQGGGLAHEAGEYADVPERTTILGAARLSGRSTAGLTVGLMDAVTAREKATVVEGDGSMDQVVVEPLTNYFVGRAKRDYAGGDLVVGGMVTSVYRDLSGDGLASILARDAEAVGLDTEYWWGDRTYHLLASAAVTRVAGDTSAIRRIQESSARYFQRPDRGDGGNGLFSDAYDPTATELRGYGFYGRLSKQAGEWLWEVATNVRSPGFETNDIAFLTRTDFAWMSANVLRQYTEPTSWYRGLTLIGGGAQQYNFDGDLTERQVHGFLGTQLANYWHLNTFYIRNFPTLDDRLTRGGPVVGEPGSDFFALNVSTDRRDAVVAGLHPNLTLDDDGATSWRARLSLRVKPTSNVSVSLSPSYGRRVEKAQYVTTVEDPTATEFAGRRYVFGELDQRTVALQGRFDVTFTPDLSLQMFVQPFLASGHYSDFKEFVEPRSEERAVYGRDVGTITATGSDGSRQYAVDPDGAGPAESFTFSDPDFNFRSLRGNAVLRWEWRPGSTLFLVWTQERSESLAFGDLDLSRDVDGLFSAHPDNVFLVKATYWLTP